MEDVTETSGGEPGFMSSTFLVIGLGGAIGLLSVYQGAKKVGFTTCPLGMQVIASMY